MLISRTIMVSLGMIAVTALLQSGLVRLYTTSGARPFPALGISLAFLAIIGDLTFLLWLFAGYDF